MRGRLVFAFLAQLHRLDTLATATTPPGYDDDFKEPALLDVGNAIGERVRREHPPVLLPCQVESDAFEALQSFAAGNSPRSHARLVFHFSHLERAGLVNPTTGVALVHVGDRLGAIFDSAGQLVQSVRTPPGLYVTEARPIGFGLFMPRPRRNLLLVTFDERDTAAPRGVSS
jgi:hypothetical protein